jgi:hypothetical protein
MEPRRCMVFIDGSWLWHSMMSLNLKESGRKLDIGNLPLILTSEVSTILQQPVMPTGTIFTSSVPVNVDSTDQALVLKRFSFLNLLKMKYGFTMDLYEIDFKGRRLRKSDRSPMDVWHPKEKCVDISMASNLFYYQQSYDIAIAVTGDKDFLPALRRLRLLGKDVIIATFQASCSQNLYCSGGYNEFPVIVIDRLLEQGKITF